MQLELRHLRYFLAVAEELSFTRAAERLHVAQPALSAQVRQLETQLGCNLFDRTTRKVELTPQGRVLAEDARDIIARADRAVARVGATARGERGVLRLGFLLHGAAETGTEILQRFGERFPEIELESIDATTLEEGQAHVRDHVTDAGFAWLPVLHAQLDHLVLRAERKCVALHEDHPLAANDEVAADDLRTEPIVAPWEHVTDERTLAYWMSGFRPHGREPFDPSAKSLDECFARVVQREAVYCVPDSVPRLYVRPHVVFRPIAGVSSAEVALIWRSDTRNPIVERLVAVAREVVAVRGAGDGAIQKPAL
jgi:DNA-binding transcriptional LysR family regulator